MFPFKEKLGNKNYDKLNTKKIFPHCKKFQKNFTLLVLSVDTLTISSSYPASQELNPIYKSNKSHHIGNFPAYSDLSLDK